MIGQTVSHYRIVEKLGEGGMGVVYKADDTKLHRAVALKFLAPDKTRDEEAKRRFMHEAQAASALDHPNIAIVHEIDETNDGRSFICMAYYPGQTLKEKIETGPLPIDEAVDISLQIANGLLRAHEAGIVHRDIKPANIIITERGEVKIVDFGIAKLAGSSTLGTTQKSAAGTAPYMSPEQILGHKVELHSDLFSLGVVLYEMVTGRRPFAAEHESALFYTILNIEPTLPTALRSDLPSWLEEIILKLLKKEPALRYQSAEELRANLLKFMGRKPEFVRPLEQRIPRKWRIRVLAAASVLVVGAIGAWQVAAVRTTVQEWFRVQIVPAEKHIVVLPFTNLSENPRDQALCDGLVEAVTSTLTQLQPSSESYWVVAATEVKRQNISSVADARKAFGVTMAVTGSVLAENMQIRVTLNLVEARTSRQVRSLVLDESRVSLSRLQNGVVVRLAELLEVQIDPQKIQSLALGGTTVSTAYDVYLQARGYLQRYEKLENILRAIELLQTAIKEDSTYALAYALLGEAFLRRFERTKESQWIQEAIQYSSQAVNLNDQLAPVHLTMGMIHRTMGRYEEAVQEFRRTLEIDPLRDDAYAQLAMSYQALADIERSEATYKRAIDLKPTYWAGHNVLGAFYYRQGRYKDAASEFEKVVELTPDNFRGHNNLGGVYFYLNRWEEAHRSFQRSIELQPNYQGFYQLGVLGFYERRYAEAAGAYAKALELQGTDYRVWGALAASYYWSGEKQKAEVTYQKAIEIAEGQRKVNPSDGVLLSDLADFYSMLGNSKEAKRLAEQALSVAPRDVRVLGRVGIVYEQIGERENALQWLGKSFAQGFSPDEVARDPSMKQLLSDPEYQKLVKEVKK